MNIHDTFESTNFVRELDEHMKHQNIIYKTTTENGIFQIGYH